MTNMTLALPEELHKIMKAHSEIRWSEIARQALWTNAKKLELMNKLLKNSHLSEEDALSIGRKVNSDIAKRHKISK
ncbi:MAG: hypothetical protein AABX11_01225 [Nanoarchaeota archaeon]